MKPNPSTQQEVSPAERQLLVAAYQAFNSRNIDAVLAMMTPDVDWPNGMEGGYVKGQAGVREYWVRQWKMINPSVEPVRFHKDSSGRIVVAVHQIVYDLSGELLMDVTLQHSYQFEDGLIRSMQIQPV